MHRKVMINALSARGGGGQTYLINIIKYFDRKDIHITILLTRGTNLDFSYKNIVIYEAPEITRNPIIRQIWEMVFLPWILYRKSIDIFFCPGGTIPLMAFFQGKTITMFRNMLPFDDIQKNKYQFGFLKFRNWMLSKIMISSMMRADLVIFISKYAESVISKKIKRPLKKSTLIPHGVDFAERPYHDNPHSFSFLEAEEEYILYPSSIDVYKSQCEVIESYSTLIKEGIAIPKLILAGSLDANKTYTKKVIELIEVNNLVNKVILTGNIPYEFMPSLYKKCKFVVYASQTENCPNILLEAMSCNCLILCSNFQPMPEFAKDSVLYFDPTEPDDLASQIKKVLNNDIDEDFLKEKIPEIILQYSWQDCSNKTWKQVRELA